MIQKIFGIADRFFAMVWYKWKSLISNAVGNKKLNVIADKKLNVTAKDKLNIAADETVDADKKQDNIASK